MGEVHPSVFEKPAPITQNTFNRRTCIKLHAKRIKNLVKNPSEGSCERLYLLGKHARARERALRG
jgi:hypothetical protein